MSNLSQFIGGNSDIPTWVSGTTYAAGKVVRSPADFYQTYVRVVAGAGTTDPASDSANWKPAEARAIKSIQRGVVAVSTSSNTTTVTISAVNTAKTEVRFLGSTVYYGSAATFTDGYVSLTNSTTLTFLQKDIPNSGSYSWELTEYY